MRLSPRALFPCFVLVGMLLLSVSFFKEKGRAQESRSLQAQSSLENLSPQSAQQLPQDVRQNLKKQLTPAQQQQLKQQWGQNRGKGGQSLKEQLSSEQLQRLKQQLGGKDLPGSTTATGQHQEIQEKMPGKDASQQDENELKYQDLFDRGQDSAQSEFQEGAAGQPSSLSPTEALSSLEERYQEGYGSYLSGNLRQFGYDIFRRASAQPSLLAVPDEEYVLGPGDQLRVRLWGTSVDTQYTGEVAPDGTFNAPKIGIISVAGVQLGEVESLIRKEAVKYVQGINIDVSLEKLRSMEIYVVGTVNAPGLHLVPAFSTAFKGLIVGGGVTKKGSLRRIHIYRKGNLFKVIDLYELILQGSRTSDVQLSDGDVLYVPRIGPTAAVAGAVHQEGIYELKPGKRTIGTLLELGGGILPQAFTGRVYLRQYARNREFVIQDIDTSKQGPEWKQIALGDGDLLEIQSLSASRPDVVRLLGHVNMPDVFQYEPGLKLSDILTTPELLKPEAITEFALLHRYHPESTEYTVKRFPLQRVLEGTYDQDLKPLDQIRILSRDEMGITHRVRITGAIWKPGQYKYRPDMTLSDLLAMAGGVQENMLIPEQGFLYRYDQEKLDFTSERFDIQAVLDGKKDILLQPLDRIRLLSRSDFEKDFTVSISGAIWKPGQYEYNPGVTLSDLLAMAGGVQENMLIPEQGFLYRYDQEKLDFTSERFDIQAVLDGKKDILLQPLDRIRLLSRSDFEKDFTVSISGAIWKPGQYEYKPGVTLSDLFLLAGGEKYGAKLSAIEISRKVIESDEVDTKHLVLNLAQHSNFQLKPYDYVLVPRRKGAATVETVTLTGELKYPETYRIRDGEKLSEVIARAGGFTDKAYFYAAEFTSKKARSIQQNSIETMIQRLQMQLQRIISEQAQTAISEEGVQAAVTGQSAALKLINELQQVEAKGRVALKLAPLSSFAGSRYDFALEDGDTLHVPKRPNFVTVVGSVYSPSAYLYVPSLTLGDYLEKSGGPTKTADEDYIYVLKANGEVISEAENDSGFFRGFEDIELMAGDTVVVPEDLDRVPYLRIIRDVSDIMFKIATTAGVALAL